MARKPTEEKKLRTPRARRGGPKKADPQATLECIEEKAKKRANDPHEQQRAAHAFGERVDRCLELEVMTTTPAWKRLYAWLRAQDRAATEALRTVEKARDLVRAQETVKLISGKDGILAEVKRHVVGLNDFGNDLPLFRALATHRAIFDEISGTVAVVAKDAPIQVEEEPDAADQPETK